MEVQPYWNEDGSMYAALISSGYGSSWSADTEMPELAYDKRVVEWYLQHQDDKDYWDALYRRASPQIDEVRKMFREWGYKDYIWFGGLKPGMLRWVPKGQLWRVAEYDGAEHIEFFNKIGWICYDN